jgi:hypothetical protein
MCDFGSRTAMRSIGDSNGLAFIGPATAPQESRGDLENQSREVISRSSTIKSAKPLQWLPIRSGTIQNM